MLCWQSGDPSHWSDRKNTHRFIYIYIYYIVPKSSALGTFEKCFFFFFFTQLIELCAAENYNCDSSEKWQKSLETGLKYVWGPQHLLVLRTGRLFFFQVSSGFPESTSVRKRSINVNNSVKIQMNNKSNVFTLTELRIKVDCIKTLWIPVNKLVWKGTENYYCYTIVLAMCNLLISVLQTCFCTAQRLIWTDKPSTCS